MEESRKQFESAFEEKTGWDAEDYPNQDYVDTLWDIWQTSRTAIEIELPHIEIGYEMQEYFEPDDVKNSIRAAGLKIKGE